MFALFLEVLHLYLREFLDEKDTGLEFFIVLHEFFQLFPFVQEAQVEEGPDQHDVRVHIVFVGFVDSCKVFLTELLKAVLEKGVVHDNVVGL